jgi:hypothetical protein
MAKLTSPKMELAASDVMEHAAMDGCDVMLF